VKETEKVASPEPRSESSSEQARTRTAGIGRN